MRISRADPEDRTGKRRRHFEISIDSPFTVLDCRATQANTALPQYCGRNSSPGGQQVQTMCGCPDSHPVPRDSSPTSSTGTLAIVDAGQESQGVDQVNNSALPVPPQAAHLQPGTPTSSASPIQRVRNQDMVGSARPASPVVQHRPMELLRYPSYNPPAFDADEPPPPLLGMATPPPNYDMIVGTPSVDGLADYFARLADYEDPDHNANDVHPAVAGHATGLGITDGTELQASPGGDSTGTETETEGESGDYITRGRNNSLVPPQHVDEDSDTDSGDDHPARIHHGGRVNVANPRTPGGRLVPSRSLELERPVMRLSMAGVVRRGEQS